MGLKIQGTRIYKEKGLEDILVPLIGDWDKPKDVDWEKLLDRICT